MHLPRSAWFVLMIALALIGCAMIRVARVITQPSDRARADYGDTKSVWTRDGIVIVPIEAQPAGLRRNDIVIALAGQPMETWARALIHPVPAGTRFEFSQTVPYTVLRHEREIDVAFTLRAFPLGALLIQQWGNLVFAIPALVVAGFVFLRRPATRAAQLFLVLIACLGSLGVMRAFGLRATDLVSPFDFWYFWIAVYGFSMLLTGATLHFALVFPRPHPLILRYRLIIPLVYTMPYLVLAVYLIAIWNDAGHWLEWFGAWTTASDRVNLVYLMLTLLALLSNYRNVRHDATARQQARWVVFGFSVTCSLFLILTLLPKLISGYPQFDRTLFGVLLLPVPVSMGVAILRHQLFDIDLIINRAIVYTILSAITMGMYIAIVGALGVVFQANGDPLTFFLATGVVAVLFQPIRERIQRGVNRLMYGERDDPYAVLSRLGQRLETIVAPNAIVPTIVETIARALKLPRVEIRLGDDAPAVAFGASAATTLEFPLVYQNETLGELRVAPRAGETLSSADHNLLRDLARQTGIAIHAARVTADLQRSREQIVLAREEERRRLRRDLHDDLAPTLASLGLTASTAADLIPTNPTTATTLVKELQSEIRATVANIRRLVYDLRPPTLDELGLLAAVRERAAQYSNAPDGFAVTVNAPAALPALPAAIEVAAYRIIQEALENVARHSRARHCAIRFAIHDALEIEITDDGIGLPPSITPGVGLRSMRERTSELGGECVIARGADGGTRVIARLPMTNDATRAKSE